MNHQRKRARQMSEYKQRDTESLAGLYLKHVEAMTEEKLHHKHRIAAELAHRDERIAELEDERSTCPDCNAEYLDHDGVGFCGCKEDARMHAEKDATIATLTAEREEMVSTWADQAKMLMDQSARIATLTAERKWFLGLLVSLHNQSGLSDWLYQHNEELQDALFQAAKEQDD